MATFFNRTGRGRRSVLVLMVLTGLHFMVPTAQVRADDQGADLFQKAWKLDQGLDTPINIPEAIRLYRQSAALGNPLAKARLARIYFSGNGVVADIAEAERLSQGIYPAVLQAAEKNDTIAEMIAGTMVADGLGVARDSAAGLQWLRKAADQGLPLAQANLGVMYEDGTGMPPNITEAAKWYRKAADQNSAMGQAYLGDLYHEGRGLPHDDTEAARLYRLAADQNFAHGQTNLGWMYSHGCAVEYNPSEAVRLYLLAANQNFAVAQANLGVICEQGCGVQQDTNVAIQWYRLAAAQGNKSAIKALQRLGCQP